MEEEPNRQNPSEEVLEEVPHDLRCPICLSVFLNPVILACGHSFCKVCVEGHLNSTPSCPQCKTPAFFGGDAFNQNFSLKALIDSNYSKQLQQRIMEENGDEMENGFVTGSQKEKELEDQRAADSQAGVFKNVIVFPTKNKPRCTFPGSTVEVVLEGKLQKSLFDILCRGKVCFIDEPYNCQGTKIAGLMRVIQTDFDAPNTKLVMKCISRHKIINSKTINVAENPEFAKKYLGNESAKLFMDLYDVVDYKDEKEEFENDPQLKENVSKQVTFAKVKMAHFVNLLQKTRHGTYHYLRQTRSLDFLEDYNIELTSRTLSSFTLQATSALNMKESDKIELFCLTSSKKRLERIESFLKEISLDLDPVAVLAIDSQSDVSIYIQMVAAILIVLLAVGGLLYRHFYQGSGRR